MDRAFRILTIYHRLLQNKKVNKKSLALMLNTSTRTIQRDIDDIRNFLYESEHWLDTQYEVKYDYDFESYTINHSKTRHTKTRHNRCDRNTNNTKSTKLLPNIQKLCDRRLQ
ncbi:HTH domain-containing protein [Staphylococcus chromogenes]|uniref:HTH domain-containing protein n=1 Tax=Staphylococcus chromogenes TaxID=46126 RepID=UPI0034DB653E